MSIDKGVNLPCLVASCHTLLPDPVPTVSGCHTCAVLLPECPKYKCGFGTASLGELPLGFNQVSVPAAPGYFGGYLSSQTQQGKTGATTILEPPFVQSYQRRPELGRMGCSIQAAVSPEGLASPIPTVQKSPREVLSLAWPFSFWATLCHRDLRSSSGIVSVPNFHFSSETVLKPSGFLTAVFSNISNLFISHSIYVGYTSLTFIEHRKTEKDLVAICLLGVNQLFLTLLWSRC